MEKTGSPDDKRYVVIKEEEIQAMLKSFVSHDEFNEFMQQMFFMERELALCAKNMDRYKPEDPEFMSHLIRYLFTFSVFCRENFEALRSLVKNLSFREISELEKDELLRKNEVKDMGI